jgi:hypothetical protein
MLSLVKLSSKIFEENFKVSPGCQFDGLFEIMSGIVDQGISISQFQKFRSVVEKLFNEQESAGNLDKRLKLIHQRLPPLENCFFYPHDSWSRDDCIEWLNHIGFKHEEAISISLNGMRFLSGFTGFDQNSWQIINDLYNAYDSRF